MISRQTRKTVFWNSVARVVPCSMNSTLLVSPPVQDLMENRPEVLLEVEGGRRFGRHVHARLHLEHQVLQALGGVERGGHEVGDVEGVEGVFEVEGVTEGVDRHVRQLQLVTRRRELGAEMLLGFPVEVAEGLLRLGQRDPQGGDQLLHDEHGRVPPQLQRGVQRHGGLEGVQQVPGPQQVQVEAGERTGCPESSC